MIDEPDKQIIENICKRHKVKFLILFGSKAKGNANKISDTDLAVYFESKVTAKTELDFFYDVVSLLATDKIDVVTLNHAEPLLLKEVALYGVPLFEKKESIFDNFIIKAIAKYQDTKKYRQFQNQLVEEYIKTNERKAV